MYNALSLQKLPMKEDSRRKNILYIRIKITSGIWNGSTKFQRVPYTESALYML